MIGVRLTGGLGNQLFQYAAGRALALRHHTELCWDVSPFQRKRRDETPRALELGYFRVCGAPAASPALARAGALRRLPWLARCVTPWRVYAERGLGFNAAYQHLGDQTLLVGYWQSYRYFEPHAATIAQELSPALPLHPQTAALCAQMQEGESVAVHVRRGDYVNLKAAASLHGALPLAYYTQAIERITQSTQRPCFFVFSDDPQWCAEHLPLQGHQVVPVVHNAGSNAWQDLVLMGHCRHHVIANSSFSWWGAWLGDQRWRGQPRTVVAPAQWFAGHQHDTSDRFPPHWSTVGAWA